jgi:hypothetical protein
MLRRRQRPHVIEWVEGPSVPRICSVLECDRPAGLHLLFGFDGYGYLGVFSCLAHEAEMLEGVPWEHAHQMAADCGMLGAEVVLPENTCRCEGTLDHSSVKIVSEALSVG